MFTCFAVKFAAPPYMLLEVGFGYIKMYTRDENWAQRMCSRNKQIADREPTHSSPIPVIITQWGEPPWGGGGDQDRWGGCS